LEKTTDGSAQGGKERGKRRPGQTTSRKAGGRTSSREKRSGDMPTREKGKKEVMMTRGRPEVGTVLG